ncbi:MAG: DNA primase, partial [Candidatus Poribacteria bacterium]|nr:DNA primase [Candidatus Poribacteria bacterium]
MKQASNHIPPEILEDIRSQNDIAEVISECGILLKPAGKTYKALCPFHDEKTPSFTASPEKRMFYCFGCNTGGDVISFLRKHDGKSFMEAVEWLANRAGISLPNQDGKSRQISRKRLELQDLNRFAVEYFHRQLLTPRIGGQALAYVKNRGITDQTIRQFQLGYATPGRRDLVKAATQAGFSIQQLIDVGLIKNEEQGPMDRFRGRVIFPILDERSIPVGFGGRALAGDQRPKYLNSPTTALYDKSKILYNLYAARPTIQKTGKVILVEGYFDALMPYQAGIQNVVASLGTSFSESHASIVKRFAEEAVILYDSDPAGFQATLRGLHLLLKEGLRVQIAILPPGADPDQFIRAQGVDAFNQLTDAAMNLIEFQIQRATQQQTIRHIDAKAQAVKEIALTLSHIKSRVELNEYAKYAARELDIDLSVLRSELRRLGVSASRPTSSTHRARVAKKASMSPRESIEGQLIETLMQSPDLIPLATANFHYNDFTHPDFAAVAQILWEASEFENPVDIQNIINTCTDEKVKGIISKAVLQRAIHPN